VRVRVELRRTQTKSALDEERLISLLVGENPDTIPRLDNLYRAVAGAKQSSRSGASCGNILSGMMAPLRTKNGEAEQATSAGSPLNP
jgi:hypothetical protein